MQTGDNPLDQTGLCLLSLDGGGVRGLSSLLILKALMASVNDERSKEGQPRVKPCEIFNLIGGTSTGGIIAIMLGRLEMDVDECIELYNNMFKTLFGKKRLPITLFGKIKGRYDSKVLEKCVQAILAARGLSEKEPLINENGSCKVVVCAKAAEISTTVLLRSYTSSDPLNNIPATICEAIRATSAATSFFEPVSIGPHGRKFVDGALGTNNPVDQIWNEAQNIWCSGESELRDLLKCFISVGTGNPGNKPIAEGALRFSKTLVEITTGTEDTAKLFVARHRSLYEGRRYFRFNVQQGLQAVGLDEYKKTALIDAATAEYMDLQETKSDTKACIANLKQRQIASEFSSSNIIEYNHTNRAYAYTRNVAFNMVPFSRNVDFVARDDIFNKLDNLLTSDGNYRSIAIWGLGGSGKTQIALEYAYSYQEKTSCSLFWVRADNEARFTQSYSEIARLANLSTELRGEEMLKSVQLWMEQQTTEWLLVLDNVDDLRIFKTLSDQHIDQVQPRGPELLRFVPKRANRKGRVMWTSRDGAVLGSLVSVNGGVEVATMTKHESLNLFRGLSGLNYVVAPSEEEEQLLQLLERLPLAIIQAAAHVRKTRISLRQYLKLFNESEERESNLLDAEFGDVYRSDVPNSVMRTWLISMEQISNESQCAETILYTIAFFDNQGIPFELLKAAAGPNFNEDEVLLAAARLAEYSFLQVQRKVDDGMPDYEEHRLVQLAARKSLQSGTERFRSYSGKALRIMTDMFPDPDHENWKACNLYLPHSLKASARWEAGGFDDPRLKLFSKMGQFYWQQGRSNEAEQLEVQVLELSKAVLGERHPGTIMAMSNLASTWWQQGRSNEAEQLKVQVLELRKAVLGERHPGTILAMSNLASTYSQQGRSDEAEQLQVQVLELRKAVLGERHPGTITAMSNLALTWSQQGRSDEAEQLEVQVLELSKAVLGERHPDTITAMSNLASTWWQQGRPNEAEQLQVQVLELRKAVLRERHPDTILAMSNLALMSRRQGRSKKANQLKVHLLELKKNMFH